MRLLSAFAILCTAGSIAAAKPKAKGEGCKAQPGVCCPDPATPRVRICYASPSGGAFDVRVHYPDTLLIVLEGESPLRVVPPSPEYFDHDDRGNSVAITPKGANLPSEANVQVVTKHQRFTVNLHPSKDADAQLHIRDPELNSREAEIERRVREGIAAKEKELEEAEKRLDEKASSRATDLLLSEIARSGMEVREPRGKAARNENVILRAISVARVGERRFLLFSVQNRSGKKFHLMNVQLSVDERPSSEKARMARQDLPIDVGDEEEVTGAFALPQARSGAKLRLVVEESDPRRNVAVSFETP